MVPTVRRTDSNPCIWDPPRRTEAVSLWTRQSSREAGALPDHGPLVETDKNIRDSLLTHWGPGGRGTCGAGEASRGEASCEAVSGGLGQGETGPLTLLSWPFALEVGSQLEKEILFERTDRVGL